MINITPRITESIEQQPDEKTNQRSGDIDFKKDDQKAKEWGT